MNAKVQSAVAPANEPGVFDLSPRYDEAVVATDNVTVWRRSILTAVAAALSDPRMPEIQKQGALWAWNDQIPYPTFQDFTILDDGMKFEVDVGGHLVIFSIWLQIGEVRVGVKIPHALSGTDAIRTRIGKAYDGTPCQRTVTMGQATLYDWIWKDSEFAEFAFAVRSLRDTILSSVIADRIVRISIHLYMSVINTLIEGHHFKVGFRRITRMPLKMVEARVYGDYSAFEWYVMQVRGYTIAKKEAMEKGRKYAVLMPVGGAPIHEGVCREPDGAECSIVEVRDAPTDGAV